jgi:hypothetical protein
MQNFSKNKSSSIQSTCGKLIYHFELENFLSEENQLSNLSKENCLKIKSYANKYAE